MPLSLVMSAAGKGLSALGGGKGGPSQQMKSSGSSQTNQTQTGTSTPNLSPLMGGFQNSLVPALSSMYQKAQTPVYGAQQIAQVANQGDQATNAASNALSANLARRGALNSGAQAAGQTALQQGNESNITGFENQVPLLNYQNEMQQTGNVLGLAENLTGKALQTNTGNSTNNVYSTNTGTQAQYGPGVMQSLMNSFGGGLTAGGYGYGPFSNLGSLFQNPLPDSSSNYGGANPYVPNLGLSSINNLSDIANNIGNIPNPNNNNNDNGGWLG